MSIACHGLSDCKTYKEQADRIKALEEECEAWREAESLWSRVINFRAGRAQDRIHDQACLASRKAQELHRGRAEGTRPEEFQLCEHCECRRDHRPNCQCTNDE